MIFVIRNRSFTFVFNHEWSSRTVKTTRVLGCNHRNRRRIGRGLGKVINGECEIVFGPGFPNQGWREKIAPPDGCTGFRWITLWQWYVWLFIWLATAFGFMFSLNFIKWIEIEIVSHAVIQLSYSCLHVTWTSRHKIWFNNSCSNSDRLCFSRQTKIF